jgi:hypothetical protein
MIVGKQILLQNHFAEPCRAYKMSSCELLRGRIGHNNLPVVAGDSLHD